MRVVDSAGILLVQGKLSNGVYKAQRALARPPYAARAAVDATLFHRCFGHVGLSTLAEMSKNGSASNLPPTDLLTAQLNSTSVCGPCSEGKQKAEPIPRSSISLKARVPYAKLHVDIAQIHTSSAGGSQYFTVMVDEATGFNWVFTHGTKDQCAESVNIIADCGRFRPPWPDLGPSPKASRAQTATPSYRLYTSLFSTW
jgi:hypothetical protein